MVRQAHHDSPRKRVIARYEAISDKTVGDKHIEDCHAALAMTRFLFQNLLPFAFHLSA
jgi:hypothetical protein